MRSSPSAAFAAGPCNAPVERNGNALALEKLLSEAVRHSGTERGEEYGMIRQSLIQFRERRQPIFREKPRSPIANRGYPGACRNRLGAVLEQGHRLGDACSGFDHHVISRALAEQHKMIVIIDQAGHNHSPVQIDHFRARIQFVIGERANIGETACLNGHFVDDAILGVERMNLAVDEAQVARPGAGILAGGRNCCREHGQQRQHC